MLADICALLVIGSSGIQLFFILFFYFRLKFYKKGQEAIEVILKPVSVVVCAHNELENLQKLIPALLSQNYPDFEIIIVDDRSSDDTHSYLYELRQLHPSLKVVQVSQTPDHISYKKYALTLGIKAAQYDWVLLTDADCLPTSTDWITHMQSKANDNKQIVLGVSPYAYKKGLLNFIIRYETYHTAIQYLSYTLAGYPYMGVGRNLSYRKSLFLESKGFNSHLKIIGGDDDLFVNANATSKNTALCIHPHSHMISIPKETWSEWFIQKKRHLHIGRYYRPLHRFLLGLQVISHLLFWGGILLGVLVAVLTNTFGILSYIAGAGIIIRIVLWALAMYSSAKITGFKVNFLKLIIFDFIYSFYLLIVGTKAFFTKTERWM